MKSFLKTFSLSFSVAIILCATAFSAPVKPTAGGLGVLGDWTNQNMPNPTLRMATQVDRAYPTNRWWGSMAVGNTATYNLLALQMSLGPLLINFNSGASGWQGVNGSGYLLGAANVGLRNSNEIESVMTTPNFIHVLGALGSNSETYIRESATKVQSYSDWGVTAVIQDQNDSSKKMTVTFAKGSPFVFNTFASGVMPQLRFGAQNPNYWTYGNDGIILSDGKNYYGIYCPPGTTFSRILSGFAMDINLPASATVESDRYVVIALLQVGGTEAQAKKVYDEYRQYAYNFITDTKVSWTQNSDSSVSTTFNYSLTSKRTGTGFISGQTVFALYPHQWRNLSLGSAATALTQAAEFTTIRGKLKIYKGSSFTTKYKFNGILPNLTYEIPQANLSKMNTYINNDKVYNPANPGGTSEDQSLNTYRRGKALAKAANLIPILHQHGDTAGRNAVINTLKAELELWYKGQSNRAFRYDAVWGGIIGYPNAFGSEIYNDHHFHYGYFIYASAILAMFDPDFASAAQYKAIVDLLVRDIYNNDRNNKSFPFLRNFDIYEGHSWATGKGFTDAGNDGIDQESISEAMNAWAAIYLWGVATNNQDWINLGMYGYTTESEASNEYYFDIHNETYPSNFTHRGGILYDSALKYFTHWNQNPTAQEVSGIWLLPLTPSMLYLGYDTSYARFYYNKMLSESNQNTNMWKDVWLRYKSLFNASEALQDWNTWSPAASAAEPGSSLSFSYHFINFFNQLGNVSTGYYAKDASGNNVPFTVMSNSSSTTFITYNNSNAYKTVDFYSNAGVKQGSVLVPPYTTVSAKNNFENLKYDSLRTFISSGSNYVLVDNKYSENVTLNNAALPSVDANKYYVLPLAFNVAATTAPVTVKFSGNIPATFLANQINLYKYNSSANLTAVNQTVAIEKDDNGAVSVVIQATLGQAGTYVVAIERAVKQLSGVIKTTDNVNVNVTMKIYDDIDKNVKTRNYTAGVYSTSTIQGAQYVLTPEASGYAFRPENYSVTGSSVETVQNFTAYRTTQISGTIKNNINNSNVSASFDIYNSVDGSTVTAAYSGSYISTLIVGAQYVITPKANGFLFEPESLEITAGNYLNQNFKAFAVSKASGNVGVMSSQYDTLLSLYDTVAQTTNTINVAASIGVNGNYIYDNLKEGISYILTPNSEKVLYEPESYIFTAKASSDTVLNFNTYLAAYASGTVMFGNYNTPFSGGELHIYDTVNRTTYTQGFNATYTSKKLAAGRQYEIWISSPGFLTIPERSSFTANSSTIFIYDFRAYPIIGNISGSVLTQNGAPVNATMFFSGAAMSGRFLRYPINEGVYSVNAVETSMVIMPYAEQYIFKPTQFYPSSTDTFTNGQTNVIQNFTAYSGSHFRGSIKYVSDFMMPKLNMLVWDNVSNSTQTMEFSHRMPDDKDGDGIMDTFDIEFEAGVNYVITPNNPDGIYSYEPASVSFTGGTQYVRQNFTARKSVNVNVEMELIPISGLTVTQNEYMIALFNLTDATATYKHIAIDQRNSVKGTVSFTVKEGKEYVVVPIQTAAAGRSETSFTFKLINIPENYTFYASTNTQNAKFYITQDNGYANSKVYYATGTVKKAATQADVPVNYVFTDNTKALSSLVLPVKPVYNSSISGYELQEISGSYKIPYMSDSDNIIDFVSKDYVYNPKGIKVNKRAISVGLNITAYKPGSIIGSISIDGYAAKDINLDLPVRLQYGTQYQQDRYIFTTMKVREGQYVLEDFTGGVINDKNYATVQLVSSFTYNTNTANYKSGGYGTNSNIISEPQAINYIEGVNAVNYMDFKISPTYFVEFSAWYSLMHPVIPTYAQYYTGNSYFYVYDTVAKTTSTFAGIHSATYQDSAYSPGIEQIPPHDVASIENYNRLPLLQGRQYIITPASNTVYSPVPQTHGGVVYEPNSAVVYVPLGATLADKFKVETSTFIKFTGYMVSLASGSLKNTSGNAISGSNFITSYDEVKNSSANLVNISNGRYSYDVVEGRQYTITPTAANYIFNPVKYTFVASTAITVKDFQALTVSKISGNIYQLQNASAPAPVVIDVYEDVGNTNSLQPELSPLQKTPSGSNWQLLKTILSQDGFYSFSAVEGRKYLVNAEQMKSGLIALQPGESLPEPAVIVPESFEITIATVSKTQDLVAYPAVKLIGDAKNNKDDSTIGVSLIVYDVVAKTSSTKDFTGDINKDLAQGRSYVITPVAENFAFEPQAIYITPSSSTHINFKAFALGKVSGVIKNKQTNEDVAVTMHVYDHSLATATAKAFNGSHSHDVIEDRVYTFTPVAQGYVFEPESFTSTGTNQTVTRDFVALSIYDITGKLTRNGKPVAGADVYVYDETANSTATVTTNAQGVYASSITAGNNYTVTPSTQTYIWTPENLAFTSVSDSIDNADFEVTNKFTKVTPYPNPFKPSKGSTHIAFSNIKAGDKIRVYNLSGDKVFEADAAADGDYLWDVKNNSGKNIASGVYMFHVDSNGKATTGKVAIER
ncbi:glycosyl hydrolase [Endomicrobium proavitum]|uniref:glucan endo-1,3-beta-D-glucosidase n=1 Tax=Endomicrobium proavitum TaxID=1408281 RepID=A0A0G3WHP9_9BACT|nr:glycosyl hydrolase [Endomicrobium proavitum]AKL97422.1 putative Endo-1,3(4)-beta-glucanase [Endomicrobium proavitum]